MTRHSGHLLVAHTQPHDGHFLAAHTNLMATNSCCPTTGCPPVGCPHPTHGGHLLVAYTQLHDGHFFAAHTLLMATNSHWPRTGCPMLVAHTHLKVATPCCPPPAPLCVPTAGLGLLGVTPEPTAEGSRDTTPTATIGVSTALRDEAEGQPGHSPTGVGCGVGVTL